jgi:head-tail adaptor
MSKRATAGELRTKVAFKRIERTVNENGFPAEVEVTVCEAFCKWVNVHGRESFSENAMQLREPATVTCRYHPDLNDQKLILYKSGDRRPYEVISVDNVEEQNSWIEFSIQRKVEAK